MLKKITLDYVGPAKHMEVDFADRLTVITGDNSLGKSLLLDVAFFCCTRHWPNGTAVPQSAHIFDSSISTEFDEEKEVEYKFEPRSKSWFSHKILSKPDWLYKNNPGLILYCKSNGDFNIFDPERGRTWNDIEDNWGFTIPQEKIFSGAQTKYGQTFCRGLAVDWVDWQNRVPSLFERFKAVFTHLADTDDNLNFAIDTVRLPGGDVTDWPAMLTPYGIVPIPHLSDAVKRILSLAYLIVWTCYEHELTSKIHGKAPKNDLVVFIDEIETHLHPTWQRIILPALMSVSEKINNYSIQFLVVTHSPLVLAGLEPTFDETRDKILHLKREMAEVSLETLPFHPYGTASEWLMSPVFGLEEARNLPAQIILRQARDLMRQPKSEATAQQAKALEPDLRDLIPSIDPFWTGWHFFWHGLPE